MFRLSNYSLNYSQLFSTGGLDIFGFLAICRQLQVEGASLHMNNLASTEADYLRKVRRAVWDRGLALGLLGVSANLGVTEDKREAELEKARAAIRVASFLGAPAIRMFAGSPMEEADRAKAFARSAQAMKVICEEAWKLGVPVALQNHNHGALCRTSDDVLKYVELVDHHNLTLVMDTGQFAGSPGASRRDVGGFKEQDYWNSLLQMAPLAKYVRVKFYEPQADGSDAALDYDRIFNILRAAQYQGVLDIVYEGGAVGKDEDVQQAMPRIVAFLRQKIQQPATETPPAAGGKYANLQNDQYFAGPLQVETTIDGLKPFTEGPAGDAQGMCYFTNTKAEHILKWDTKARKLSIFREKTNQANGLAFDASGRLIACEGGAGRVTRTDFNTGKIEVLCDSYQGGPLGAPNDVIVDRQGRIYFTSRFPTPEKDGQRQGVYRIDPNGTLTRILQSPDIHMPNGLALSPDENRFYLIEADPRADFARQIRSYTMDAKGNPSEMKTLINFYPGRSGDGMAIDTSGNLYVAAGLHKLRGTSETLDTRPGIHVITPAGQVVAFVETPEDTITNCSFGGPDRKTLYITCGRFLLSLPTHTPGYSVFTKAK